MSRKFLVELKFEANVVIEADNEEEAMNKGREILCRRHVYEDKQLLELVNQAYSDGLRCDDSHPMIECGGRRKEMREFSDPDYICDNDPVILEEIKEDEH